MAEDWSAVAKAINERAREVGMTQRELAETSHVSLAIVREIQRNTVQRRRSTRTVEALSLALGWHPRHLSAVLHGRKPPAPSDPVELIQGRGTPERLAAIEDRLTELVEQLAEMNANIATVVSRDRRKSP